MANLRDNPFNLPPIHSAPFALPLPQFKTVDALRKVGALSRTDIAEYIGYSPSKITSIVNSLLTEEILSEINELESTGGRRPRGLGFNPNFGYVVAAKIGVTKLDIALVDFSEHIRLRRMLPIEIKDGPEKILTLMINFILERLEQLNIPLSKVYGCTVTVPASIRKGTSEVFDMSLMPTWGGYQIGNLLKEKFPHAVIIVENDANVMAFGELRKGCARDQENFIFVKIGTSLSAGIIVGGKLYRGVNGHAGDIGQIYATAQDMPLNALVSGAAIAEHARKASSDSALARYTKDEISAREVGIAAAEGDREALEIIQRAGQALGEALANLVNFFDPELILIGGGVSQIGHQLLASIRRSILDRSPARATQYLRIETATLGSEASMLGTIALALEHVFVQER